MTSSMASDRTLPPASSPRPGAVSAPHLLQRFFLRCSGATWELLSAPSCLTEVNKYVMLGAILCLTAGFAALSGGYAAYTAFRDPAVATAVGVLWGLFIFTLDRFIVSGIRKPPPAPSDTRSVRWEKSLRGFMQAVPRLVLAVFLSLVIATPLELKLFEREIAWVLAQDLQSRAIAAEQLTQEEFPDIEHLRARNQELLRVLQAKEARRDALRDQALAEAEGLGGTRIRGQGPVYTQRRAELERYQHELGAFRQQVTTEIAANTAQMTRLEAQKQQRLAGIKTAAEHADGLLARLHALHHLTRDGDKPVLGWAMLVIFLVFLTVETAPVLTKLLSRSGPYDKLLERIEMEVVLQEDQLLRSAQERLAAAAQYQRNIESAMRSFELQQWQAVMQHLAYDPQLRHMQEALTAHMTVQVLENLSQDLAAFGGRAPHAPDPAGGCMSQSAKAAVERQVAQIFAQARHVKGRTGA